RPGIAGSGGFGRYFAERLDVGLVVGDGGIQELLGGSDQAAQLIGKVAERVDAGLWRHIGNVEFVVDRRVEFALARDQNVDGLSQGQRIAQGIFEPDGEIGRGRRYRLL